MFRCLDTNHELPLTHWASPSSPRC